MIIYILVPRGHTGEGSRERGEVRRGGEREGSLGWEAKVTWMGGEGVSEGDTWITKGEIRKSLINWK